MVGVTGTKGKSTTVELISTILEEAGFKTALLSSVRKKIGNNFEYNQTQNTMPGRFFIQKFLNQAKKEKCQFAILEVTSQGVLQHRHKFIDFNSAVFLNLHPEHIESHGSYEAYRAAKVSFFDYVAKKSKKTNKIFIINSEHHEAGHFRKSAEGGGEVLSFSRLEFIKEFSKNHEIIFPNWFNGDFNLENAAAAAKFAETQGINKEIILKALKNFKGVAGRMEFIQKEPFKVIVDYAHTPDSLRAVYSSLKKEYNHTNLICVLGSSGGGRDKWKRPEFGKIASDLCDEIILTNEDPHDEIPESILNEISSGIRRGKDYRKIIDRAEAIKTAISLARPQDVIIITGKGSEHWLRLANGKKIPWSDKETAEKAISEIKGR